MKKEVLSEISQMKYLFGYKPGKVISEQTKPVSPQPEKGVVETPEQKNLNFLKDLATALKNNQRYITSSYYPKVVISPTNFNVEESQDLARGKSGVKKTGNIDFTIFGLTPTLVTPEQKSISFGIDFSRPEEIASIDDLQKYISNGIVAASAPKKPEYGLPGFNPMGMVRQMELVGGDENPKAYLEFIKNIDPRSAEWLKNDLLKIIQNNNPKELVTVANKVYTELFPETTPTT